MEIWLIAVIAVAAVLILLLVLASVCEIAAFGRRYDKNPLLKYFTAEDFGISSEGVSLPHGLNGCLYHGSTDNGKLVIFCHGMGPGHIAYTTEIAYFCNLGYNVLAVDSRGCNMSEGKAIKGMYSGVKTVIAAIDYASELNYGKIYLVGHSWGAYSALCASAQRKVAAAVAISAPASPSKTVQEAAAHALSKPLAAILKPFWWFANFIRYGVKGNSNAARCAVKNGTPTLIIHGDKDVIVTPAKAVYYKAQGEHITKILVGGKAHNPYNTESAEKLLAQLSAEMKKGVKDFSGFDFKGATEEDEEVMNKIAAFIENN